VSTQLQSRAPSFTGSASDDSAIVLEGVGRCYRRRHGAEVQALSDLSLRVRRGETLAVVGPSGCGKSTLLEILCGLQQPDEGRVATCAPAVLMPQRDLLLPWLDALDNAALAPRIAGHSRAQARRHAALLFQELGLAGFEHARPHELSGGMRQRVAFLRTLLSGKPVLCLDEPFGALDAITRADMQEWLAAALACPPACAPEGVLPQGGRPSGCAPEGAREQRTTRPTASTTRPTRSGLSQTVVLVTHDVEEAILLADRLVVLSPRPGHVVAELDVDLQRPRVRTHAAVTALRERALDALGKGAPVIAAPRILTPMIGASGRDERR
jgi:NitT/TauT family transport system ATP-binding protein